MCVCAPRPVRYTRDPAITLHKKKTLNYHISWQLASFTCNAQQQQQQKLSSNIILQNGPVWLRLKSEAWEWRFTIFIVSGPRMAKEDRVFSLADCTALRSVNFNAHSSGGTERCSPPDVRAFMGTYALSRSPR